MKEENEKKNLFSELRMAVLPYSRDLAKVRAEIMKDIIRKNGGAIVDIENCIILKIVYL